MTRQTETGARRRGKGFRRAGSLVEREIREAGEARGFAVSQVLTHWAEIAGEALAAHTRPVEISYSRGGMGGTLTVLTTGAQAPMVEMQAERLRERINACYGYNAIARVRVTQIAATGFAEGRAVFAHAPKTEAPREPAPETRAAAARAAGGIGDDDLRRALETLGAHVLSRK